MEGARVGAIIGGFRIERLLREGGMGAVYVAEQLTTGAKRALKPMPPTLCGPTTWRDGAAESGLRFGASFSAHQAGTDALLLGTIARDPVVGESVGSPLELRTALRGWVRFDALAFTEGATLTGVIMADTNVSSPTIFEGRFKATVCLDPEP